MVDSKGSLKGMMAIEADITQLRYKLSTSRLLRHPNNAEATGSYRYEAHHAYGGITRWNYRVICDIKTIGSAVVGNFEECAAAGYPVIESYPRQCRTPDGRLFVEVVPPHSIVPKKPKSDSDIVCTMEAKKCPDGTYVERIPPDCEFAPCPGKTRGNK